MPHAWHLSHPSRPRGVAPGEVSRLRQLSVRSGGGVCGGGVSGGGGGDQMTSGGEGGARGGGAPGEGSAGEGGGSGGSTITSGGSGGGGGGDADGGGGGVGGEGGEISSSHRVPLKPSLQLHAPVPSFPSLQKVLGPVLATVPSGSQSHWRQSVPLA